MEMQETLDDHIEFETKYEIDAQLLYPFKSLVQEFEKDLGPSQFIYAEGPDYYYTKSNTSKRSFARYRKAVNNDAAWWTIKEAPDGAINNMKRKELNVRVDNTPYKTIHEAALMYGYRLNFQIYKICHIYVFKEVTFVCYSVRTPGLKWDHFLEIELDEETIGLLTEDQAKDKIRNFERMLAPLGITYRNRSPRSLSERYWQGE